MRAKRKPYIPVVLSRQEVDRLIGALNYPYDLVVKLLYGCGLRLFECLQLRVQDINLEMMILTVHDGKGQKDRTLPLPQSLRSEIELQLEQVAHIHKQDLAGGYSGTFLPHAWKPNTSGRAPTHCAIAMPAICSRPTTISARSRNYWAIAMCAPR